MSTPRALFLGTDGQVYPDNLMCSGVVPGELEGRPCPFSDRGRMPMPEPLGETEPGSSPDKGKPGDLCPPCAKQALGPLRHWMGHAGQNFPAELADLRLFKCRQWFWLVVPGLRNDEPTRLAEAE